ncbi:ribosomal RNA small subunit methyltransferase H [Acrasis kona]|uniref:Ribosomal RNA small subunit methyltransferase H n=1 Tax=Acrasis kona TaxID=1008807 RepID=A0AAW2Z1S1_9EUKA
MIRIACRKYSTGFSHVPVLLNESTNALVQKDTNKQKFFIDCTFGMGGYSEKILSRSTEHNVIAIDLDVKATQPHVDRLKLKYGQRFNFFHSNYSEIRSIVETFKNQNYSKFESLNFIDGVVMDLGVSSMQLDDASRGFSFRTDRDGPLDMRMDQTSSSSIAADIVNSLSVDQLTKIIDEFGEEKHGKRIAVAICRYREQHGPFTSTSTLTQVIKDAIPLKFHKTSTSNVATRTFQALRIFVNDELNHLSKTLKQCSQIIKTGGRLCCVSFHSLEDNIVMSSLKLKNNNNKPLWKVATKEILPSKDEVESNPRSRTAKLRVFERTNHEV